MWRECVLAKSVRSAINKEVVIQANTDILLCTIFLVVLGVLFSVSCSAILVGHHYFIYCRFVNVSSGEYILEVIFHNLIASVYFFLEN